MTIMSPLTLDHRQVGFANAANCKFTASQVLALMVLPSFFAIKNSLGFAGSIFRHMFVCIP